MYSARGKHPKLKGRVIKTVTVGAHFGLITKTTTKGITVDWFGTAGSPSFTLEELDDRIDKKEWELVDIPKLYDGKYFQTNIGQKLVLKEAGDNSYYVKNVLTGEQGKHKKTYCIHAFLKGTWFDWAESSSPETVAQGLYEGLVKGDWCYVDIQDLHDKTVADMKIGKYKPHQIKQLIQNINQTNKPKESNMNTVTIEVPNKPFAETTTTTVFQQDVATMSEQDLYDALTRIQKEQDTLKALGTKQSSKRITRKIKELTDARLKVIALIDAMEDE